MSNNGFSKKNRCIQGVLYLASGTNCLLFALLSMSAETEPRQISLGIGALLLLMSPISILDRRKPMCGPGAVISVFFISLLCAFFCFCLCGKDCGILLCLHIVEWIALIFLWKCK